MTIGDIAVAVSWAAPPTAMDDIDEPVAMMAPEPDDLCVEPVRVAFQADAAHARELRLPALLIAEVKPAEGVAKTV